MKEISILIFFLFSISSYGQNKSNFGVGANVGYKSPTGESGFVFEWKIRQSFNLYGGLTYAKFNGFGYTVGADFFPIHRKFQPCLGVAFNHQSGDSFYMGQDSLDRADYEIRGNNNFVGIVGVRSILNFDDKSANGFITITPYLSYRYSDPSNIAIFRGGINNEEVEERINSRIGSGFGFGIMFLYFFDKKEKI